MKWTIYLGGVLLLSSTLLPARMIKHDAGTTLINEVPEKVVALNWTQAEILLSLGIKPVGVTSIKGYKQWQSDNPPLPDDVTELGQRAEPGLGAIAALQPDLILGYSWRHNRIYRELDDIAPTVLYRQYPNNDDDRNYFIRMQHIYRSVAAIFDKEAEAEQKLSIMFNHLKEAKTAIHDAGLSGKPVVVGKFVGMGLGLRVYGNSSMAGAIVNELGLINAWTSTLPGRDFTHADLLKLTEIDDASLIIMGDKPAKSNSMLTSPVWQALPAVKEDRVYFVPALWSFGGPDSANRMVQTLTSQLIAGVSQ